MGNVLFDKILGRVRENANGGGGGGSTPKIVEVTSVTNIPSDIVQSLNAGDVVIQSGSAYFVQSKYSPFLYLTQTSNGVATDILYYNGGGNTWSFYERRDYSINTPVYNSMPAGGMLPNAVYNLGTLSGTVTFTLANPSWNYAKWYFWTFSTGNAALNASFPSSIVQWETGSAPVIGNNEYWEITIINGYATAKKFDIPQP